MDELLALEGIQIRCAGCHQTGVGVREVKCTHWCCPDTSHWLCAECQQPPSRLATLGHLDGGLTEIAEDDPLCAYAVELHTESSCPVAPHCAHGGGA